MQASAQSGRAEALSPDARPDSAACYPSGFPPGSLAGLHASVGAVLVDDDGRLVNANPAAFQILDLDEESVGLRVGPQLAAIAIRHAYGPDNGITPSPDVVDDRVQALCLPMQLHSATLYLLWDPARRAEAS